MPFLAAWEFSFIRAMRISVIHPFKVYRRVSCARSDSMLSSFWPLRKASAAFSCFMHPYANLFGMARPMGAFVEKQGISFSIMPKKREARHFRPSTEKLSTACGTCGFWAGAGKATPNGGALLRQKAAKNMHRIHLWQAGNQWPKENITLTGNSVHRGVDESASYSHFFQRRKPGRIKGFIHFSTVSTGSTPTANI